MKFSYNAPAPIGFQIAPMLDVVFLLLVFFIVTQSFEDAEPDLTINLPQSETAKTKESITNQTIINIRQDGTVSINRVNFTIEQLEQKLLAISKLTKDSLIRIRVDEKAESGLIVNVMDACLKAGLNNISFSTKPVSTSDQKK
jgi:biopolymer transport protein ExbD